MPSPRLRVDRSSLRSLGLCFLLILIGLPSLLWADDSVVRFAVIGDMGVGCTKRDHRQCDIADLLCEYRDEFDFVLTMGDNIYEDGDPALFPSRFEQPYRCLLDQDVPFYPTLGNHDTVSSQWRYESDHVNYRYFQMYDDRDQVRRRYYSFRKGAVTRNGQVVPLVEFLSLDSNRIFYPKAPAETDQLPWLTRRLQESDAVWKIPYFHHPLYSSGPVRDGTLSLRNAFEQLFIDGGVKVVLTGHSHVFEEITPQNGIYYFISGAAGKLESGVRRASPLLEKFNDYDPHFLVVTVTEEALSWYLVDGNGEQICYVRGDDQNPIDCRGRIE